MSARLVKKILNEQHYLSHQLNKEQEIEDDDEEEEEEEEGSTAPSSINPFDLLNDNDSEPEQQEDESTEETSAVRYDRKEDSSSLKKSAQVPTSNPKSKKKKKKKNKDSAVAGKKEGEKELDLILEDLSLNANSLGEQHNSTEPNAVNAKDKSKSVKQDAISILQVDPKHLSAENELRRIFGSKVVKSFESSSHQASSSRQMRGVRRPRYTLKKTVLVPPTSNWPPCDDSLSMEFLETKNGYNYFRYVHSASYSQSQRSFEAAKAINDINGIASILQYRPYHIDSLLTMAEYFKVVGEQQMCADSIARCLYALECAWHPMFTPLQGNCQLKYGHDTNKPIFTALFTHMKNLDRRGCHRSALEVCKLLLSLDSDDPMGALFCIDYFALRSDEYAWLEKFSENYRSDNSIWLFPNFSFSLAICRFYLEREVSEASKKASSSDLMQQALMLHPSVIKKLVTKVPLKDRMWTDILKHDFFRSDQTGIPSQDHLINIYVERNYLIWRLPDLQKLLSGAAKLVVETLENNKSEVNDWACVRKEAFSSEKNEYGHLLVSDFSDSVTSIPPEHMQQLLGAQGMRGAMQDENQFANQHGNGHAPRGVANRNALAVLFESMLPWVTYEDTEDGRPDDNQHDGRGQDIE